MLTADLLRVRVDRYKLQCQLVPPGDPRTVELAEQLIATVRLAVSAGWKRAAFDEAVSAIAAAGPVAKIVQGLAKVLEDHATFDVSSPVSPAELRQMVFQAARRVGPLSLDRDLWDRPTADDVYAAVGEGLGITGAAVADALYADLESEQRVTACEIDDPTWLLHRYNLSMVQSVLLRATEIRVRLEKPATPKLRQLLRHAKFHQLMHQVWRTDDEVHLSLDGPASLFSQSARYGKQLALFLPAVVLQAAPWELTATVRWGPQHKEKTLTITHTDGLVSHLRDDGAWISKEQEGFRRRYEEANPAFSLSDQTEPIVLGPKSMVLPDFSFSDGQRVAHLEIVGFWRKEYLQRRLDALRRYAPGNLILAVSDKLCGDDNAALDDLPATVIPFAQVVPIKRVIAEIERVAR